MKNPDHEPCLQWAEKLAARHTHDLSASERLALNAHVASCPACSATLAAYQTVEARIRSLPPVSPELLHKYSVKNVQSKSSHTLQPERSTNMYTSVPDLYREQPRRQRLSLIAAVCFLTLLVGSMLAVFNLRHGATSSGTPAPMAPTQTSCPALGTARAAVMTPLKLGTHQNIVTFIVSAQTVTTSASTRSVNYDGSTLQRYDVTTGQTVTIVRLAHTVIQQAQISSDGQWILFSAYISGHTAIQMIRMDGQGLQTLYCTKGEPIGARTMRSMQWSPDQTLIVFSESTDSRTTLYLLSTLSGRLQPEFTSTNSVYVAQSWLDATHIYITHAVTNILLRPTVPSVPNLYILDIKKGANQHIADLKLVVKGLPFCSDFSSSPDGTTLAISQCYGLQEPGSSSITVQPAAGGTPRTIYHTELPITMVRMISSTTLLFTINNMSSGPGNLDTSKNGLWKINSDGSSLMRLSTDNARQQSILNLNTRYPWGTVSRDDTMYAFYRSGLASNGLFYGSLNGGTPKALPYAASLVGWTTM